MRITIWQQFSSNHSSYFTVVGEFPSEEDAIRAMGELSRLIQSIADYHQSHPEVAEVWRSEGIAPPTPPEIQMAAQYELTIDNKCGIDWLLYLTEISDAVVHMDKLVFVTHPGDTWYGAHPFDFIMKKLGGKVMVDGMQDRGADFLEPPSATWIERFTCNCVDKSAAETIETEIAQYLKASWEASQSAGEMATPGAPWQPPGISRLERDAYGRGKLERKGRQLLFKEWGFSKLAYGLAAFVAYLKHKGCTDIHYELASAIVEND